MSLPHPMLSAPTLLTADLQRLSSGPSRLPNPVQRAGCGDGRVGGGSASSRFRNQTREDDMDRRTVLKAGVATAGTLAMPAYLRAQSNKKLSILTWNIADQEALFKEEFA